MNKVKKLKLSYKKGKLSKSEYIRKAYVFHQALYDYSEFILDTDIEEINISRDGVSFTLGTDRIKMTAPRDEMRVAPMEILNFESYEADEVKIIDALAEGAENILDIGANIGWFSLHFAKHVPEAKVHAFEPIPKSFKFLIDNVSLNNLGSRVICYNYALSSENGSADFFVAPENGTNASLRNVASNDSAEKVKGLMLTLDDWCSNHSVRPDFIKCDVEGAELLVFRGGRSVIERDLPIVFTELLRKWSKPYGYHPNELLDFFSDFGYRCFAISANGYRQIQSIDDDTLETNYLFLNLEKHSKEIEFIEGLL